MTDDWQLSTMTVRTIEAFSALVQEARLTVPKIPQFAETATTSLMQLTQAHRVEIIGPPVFIYSGAGTGANDLLTMQVAFPVNAQVEIATDQMPDATALLEYEPFQCACFDFRGPMVQLAMAYAPAMDALKADGMTPIEQSREVYKHWVGYDEPDNIVEIQLGIA